MKAVFLDKQTFNEDIDLSAIASQVSDLTCYDVTSTEHIAERCKNAELVIINKVVLSADILAQLPQLKLICITATGYNNVDIDAAKKQGIAVTNVSGYAGSSVAQYVFAQILEYYQQTTHHNENTTQGLWQTANTFCYHGNAITEVAGKTISIIGYGNLGKAVEVIARAFNMNVLISERVNANNIRAGRVSFNQAISQADIVTLHCPQTSETEQLMNKKAFEIMKPTAMLINTARGALINDNALLHALKNNLIAYAALDVLDQEPPPSNHPLLMAKLSNLQITAHIAWASSEAQQRLIALLGKNIEAFKLGEKLNRLDIL